MEFKEKEIGVKERLVLSGLAELDEYGIRDFSLRRVAARAEVSCAAPYRHFKDKELLILAVIAHVREGWNLLADNIASVYSDDHVGRIVELSASAVRFWIGNGSFRAALLTGKSEADEIRRREISLFDEPIISAIREYASHIGKDPEELSFKVISMIYGTVTLVAAGILEMNEGLLKLRKILKNICLY